MDKTLKIPEHLCQSQSVKWVGAQYMPDIQPQNASKWIRREIARNPELTDTLNHLGWHPSLHNFNPRQLQAVVNHLGPFW